MHPLEHEVEPLAARIDNAGLLEHRQLIRRAQHRLVGRGDDVCQHVADVTRLVRCRFGRNADLARHREDGALDGRGHGTVCRFGRLAQRLRQVVRGDGGLLAQALAEALQDLPQDHARVTARPMVRALGSRLGHVGYGGVVPV